MPNDSQPPLATMKPKLMSDILGCLISILDLEASYYLQKKTHFLLLKIFTDCFHENAGRDVLDNHLD